MVLTQEIALLNASIGMCFSISRRISSDWQPCHIARILSNRGLERVYPIVYFDAIVVKVRQDGRVINTAIHLALAVNLSDTKELLGMWVT